MESWHRHFNRVGSGLLKITLGLSAALSLAACPGGKTHMDQARGRVSVRLPMVGPDGVEALVIRDLEGIEDLNEVSGRYARFFYAPKLTPEGLNGEAPRARFIRARDGVFVPADELSQHLAALYYGFQELARLDLAAEVVQVASGQDAMVWPRTFGIAVRMAGPGGAELTDNIFYDGLSDSILMVPYQAGRLPLALNPGVVAHEHFHAIFEHAVIRPLLRKGAIPRTLKASIHPGDAVRSHFEGGTAERGKMQPAPPLLLTGFMVKAVNEGLADVWGWIHSGDPQFVGRSLVRVDSLRNLRRDQSPHPDQWLWDRNEIRAKVSRIPMGDGFEATLNHVSYLPATALARALIEILSAGQEVSASMRVEIGRRVIKGLPQLAAALAQSPRDLDFRAVLQVFLSVEPLTDAQKAAASEWLLSGRRP